MQFKTKEKSNEIEQKWRMCLDILKEKMGIPAFEVCLNTNKLILLDEKNMRIEVSSPFAKDRLTTKFSDLIKETIRGIFDKDIEFGFYINEELNNIEDKNISDDFYFNYSIKNENINTSNSINNCKGINPRYTFETFVIGNNNRLAAAAALAVSENPANTYNPFFIYGGVGLGKTHLLHAIGNTIIFNNTNFRVVYVSAEKFTNEIIDSIRDHQTMHFRNKYRNVDVLLIDDIQFIANKERTQEEFFHTFNELYGENKQIVITSDKPPKEIPTLEERLRSRFEWGLIADIQSPDFETREAILRKKAEFEGVNVPQEITSFIAENITFNIRELEGALIRVVALSSLTKKPITLGLAKEALKDIIKEDKTKNLTINDIQKAVCNYYNIKLPDLIGPKRDQKFALPRQIAMYMSKLLTYNSYPSIGREFGDKDHTTILHAYNKISKKIDIEPNFKKTIENIKSTLLI